MPVFTLVTQLEKPRSRPVELSIQLRHPQEKIGDCEQSIMTFAPTEQSAMTFAPTEQSRMSFGGAPTEQCSCNILGTNGIISLIRELARTMLPTVVFSESSLLRRGLVRLSGTLGNGERGNRVRGTGYKKEKESARGSQRAPVFALMTFSPFSRHFSTERASAEERVANPKIGLALSLSLQVISSTLTFPLSPCLFWFLFFVFFLLGIAAKSTM